MITTRLWGAASQTLTTLLALNPNNTEAWLLRSQAQMAMVCMYVCMYVCIYVCIYVHVCMYVCMYACRGTILRLCRTSLLPYTSTLTTPGCTIKEDVYCVGKTSCYVCTHSLTHPLTTSFIVLSLATMKTGHYKTSAYRYCWTAQRPTHRPTFTEVLSTPS